MERDVPSLIGADMLTEPRTYYGGASACDRTHYLDFGLSLPEVVHWKRRYDQLRPVGPLKNVVIAENNDFAGGWTLIIGVVADSVKRKRLCNKNLRLRSG